MRFRAREIRYYGLPGAAEGDGRGGAALLSLIWPEELAATTADQ